MNKKRVEKLLNVDVTRIIPYRNHWLVFTRGGEKWVAKMVNSHIHLRWWISVDHELRMKGFLSMPSMKTDGSHLVLTQWIKGKSGTYRDLDQTVTMIKQLAYFHQIGHGLQTPPKREAAFLLYDRLYNRLKRFYRLIKQVDSIPGQLGELLSLHGPQFYQDGFQVWQQLQQLPLQFYTLMDREYHRLAHRDLACHNWLVERQNKVWLIDFDLADYDSQIGDIWQMLARVLPEHQWSVTIYEKLLKSYESIRPLSADEKRLLSILMRFPNEFFRESLGLTSNKRGYLYRNTFPYLQRLAKNRKRWLKHF